MAFFHQGLPKRSPLRQQLLTNYVKDEKSCLEFLLQKAAFSANDESAIAQIATDLIKKVRGRETHKTGIESLMSHFSLTSEEGILLMCLAEALLRIPDKKTQELLIKDKLMGAKWDKYVGAHASRFVNLVAWSLSLSGKIVRDYPDQKFKHIWYGMMNRLGEPVIREAIRHTMKLMSEHFVLGNTIEEALTRSKPLAEEGYFFSYDMLGEMACTMEQASFYFSAYQKAIDEIANSLSNTLPSFSRPTISIKLSALYPRYEFTHRETAVPFLIAELKKLVLQAKKHNIYVTIDAEEATRLDMSLDIFEAVYTDPDLNGWEGLGLAVQAYQKRCYALLEWLIDLARTHQKKIGVRLVKGAYWDSEIKMSQVDGYDDYPVFTRKSATDVSYLACAKLLLSANDVVYPQFATHNAHTAASIIFMTRGTHIDFEFQSLQGMGGPLHGVLVNPKTFGLKSRIYAPVGKHTELLPYLVRRLLENGANTSFVHQIADTNIAIEKLIESPIQKVKWFECQPNKNIPKPSHIYPNDRLNSKGFDASREDQLALLQNQMVKFDKHQWHANALHQKSSKDSKPVLSPSNTSVQIGSVVHATEKDIETALKNATDVAFDWNLLGVEKRAMLLLNIADLMERDFVEFMVLLQKEAGKTFHDAVAEIREAVDFCRYYAMQARLRLIPEDLVGATGESNRLYYVGRGVVICISPWNFPLAIFMGQVVASLVAGNCVIAKPAMQTTLIAAKAITICHEAGIPKEVLQFLPASGKLVDQMLIANPQVKAVIFTGSTETAKIIQRRLAEREDEIVPFIAETGGINAMVVDSSALLEQVVADVMISAFGSAGQRCSALRLLCIQDTVADAFIAMLQGAMKTWTVDHPQYLLTDVGPVIDQASQSTLLAHIDEMHKHSTFIGQIQLSAENDKGFYVAPTAFELSSVDVLTKEVFGPILHVVRYREEDRGKIVDQINAKGFGLTFGIQTRILLTTEFLERRIVAGNIYVNRSMTGAVVGVQPFGGSANSGTGPKAGGPNYLLRLCREVTVSINTTATGGNAQLLALEE